MKCPDAYVSLMPESLSFADAASLPLAGVTALQVLGQYKGSLEGKTVLIPGGCKSLITTAWERNINFCI